MAIACPPQKVVSRATLPRVLIVEDEAIVAMDFQRRLTRLGYTVTGVAYDGQQAIQKAGETRPELILMDINLGKGLSGIETALIIQQQQNLPVIYVTANSDADTVRRAARSCPFGYVLKPFEDRELETAIQMGMVKHEIECRLRESERRFNATLSSMADGLVATDAGGRVEFFNPSAEAITGWPQGDVLGRRLTDVLRLHDDSGPAGSDFMAAFSQPQPLPQGSRTARLERRDGLQVPVEYRAAGIRDERQHLAGLVVSFSDIRERRRAEEAIRCAQLDLTRAHAALTRKHEELQSFYHTVSHEVKTPLTSAREFVALVLESLAGPINPTQREYLSLALESCDQMRDCINDLLDATRLETGKMSVELKPASLGDLAKRVVAMLKPAAEHKDIRLTCAVRPGLQDISMDAARIAQVLTNLLNNALKFTAAGGLVAVTVGPATERSDWVELAVADTGCGIPADQQGRIFDRLYQVKDPGACSAGLGLGLHICHELVALHRGSIRVESQVGNGSTFYVTLPILPPEPVTAKGDDALRVSVAPHAATPERPAL
jgi:PAS domain S-box-containing protein